LNSQLEKHPKLKPLALKRLKARQVHVNGLTEMKGGAAAKQQHPNGKEYGQCASTG
jgi:hypothetical protein